MSESFSEQPGTSDTAASIDAIVLACATDEWSKVAIVIARATDAARAQNVSTTAQSLAARVYALAEASRIETRGNVRRWRDGEIRARQIAK